MSKKRPHILFHVRSSNLKDAEAFFFQAKKYTLQGTDISHLGKGKSSSKVPLVEDMLVLKRVYHPVANAKNAYLARKMNSGPKVYRSFSSFKNRNPITQVLEKYLVTQWPLHPGRLTWNIQITHLERKMIFPTSLILFHVNLTGCNYLVFFRGQQHLSLSPSRLHLRTWSQIDRWTWTWGPGGATILKSHFGGVFG